MKVAILTPTFSHFSGIDRVVEQQALDLTKQGNDVTVFALESTIPSNGFKVVSWGMPAQPFWQRLYRLFFFLDFNKIDNCTAQLEGFDRVISHFYPMNIIAEKAKERFGIKYIAWNHGIGFPYLFSNPLEKWYMQLFRKFSNRSMQKADKIFSVSKFLADELKNETGLSSQVLYNSIDKAKYHPGLKGDKIRKKHNLGKDPVILFVGRLSPHKGVHLLIDAFRIVRQNKSSAKLLVVGKPTFPKYYEELKSKADKNIIFAGFIDDDELPLYYAACNVYATASLWEGFDIPVVEAQACGKLVVAFDVCSHKEVVKNGKLVKENDVEGFARAIIEYLK